MTPQAVRRRIRQPHHLFVPTIAALLGCVTTRAFAAGAGMPWEGPILQLGSSLTGPVAKIIGIAAIAACGVGLAMSEGGHGARKIIGVLLGVSVLFTASTFWVSFLGFSGGVAL